MRERLLGFTLPVVSAAAYARPAEVDRKPVGTGPYRLEGWVPKQALTLRRREDVPASAYPFAKIVFRIIPDNAVRFQAGTRGELDEFYVTRDQVPAAQRSPEFQSRNRLVKAPQFLVVDGRLELPQPDPRRRPGAPGSCHGLAASRYRQAALPARRSHPGVGTLPAGCPGERTRRPAAAIRSAGERAPARRGGAEDGPGRVPSARRPARLVGVSLHDGVLRSIAPWPRSCTRPTRKSGVELVLRPLDWAAYFQRFSRPENSTPRPGLTTPLPPKVDPYPSYHSSQTPPNGQNTGFYRNPEADRVMEAARREMDDTQEARASTARCTACSPRIPRQTSCGTRTSTGGSRNRSKESRHRRSASSTSFPGRWPGAQPQNSDSPAPSWRAISRISR